MIVVGFPGVGKTTLAREGFGIDFECWDYHWKVGSGGQVLNPEWPGNYVDAAVQTYREETFKHIFISSHQEVVDELAARDIFYWFVVPHVSCREAYAERYRKRGSSQAFIDAIIGNWGQLLRTCHAQLGGQLVILEPGKTLEDVLPSFE